MTGAASSTLKATSGSLAGAVLLSGIGADSGFGLIAAAEAVIGLGMGLALPTAGDAVIGELPVAESGSRFA